MLGLHSTLIPLQDALDDDGDLRIVYERDYVKDAPSIEPEDDRICDDDADLLHRYYGLERVTGMTAPDADDDIDLPRETRDAEPPGLTEGPDSPLTKRRHERAKELGVPSATTGVERLAAQTGSVQACPPIGRRSRTSSGGLRATRCTLTPRCSASWRSRSPRPSRSSSMRRCG